MATARPGVRTAPGTKRRKREAFREGNGSVARRKARTEIFLNLPYDPNFENLFPAYVCASHAIGLVPRVTLEIPGGARRLDRIFALIRQCAFSVHDLSRVQLDRNRPRTPRFNMPFELGLAVAWEKTGQPHTWFVMEGMSYRLAKSLSDLNGTDPYIHKGTVEGVFREMGNAFVRRRGATVPQMWTLYREVHKQIPRILERCGTRSVFEARAFEEVSLAANVAAGRILRRR
jgi:hypothetical protein